MAIDLNSLPAKGTKIEEANPIKTYIFLMLAKDYEKMLDIYRMVARKFKGAGKDTKESCRKSLSSS